jgi:thiamine biosynthesis protein ThiS
MKISLNGDTRTIQTATNVEELIAELDLPAEMLLVEHNGLALRREEWKGRGLKDGDRIEMLRIAAGG